MEQEFWKKVAPMHEVGAAVTRVDALDKVKGTAKYTDGLCPKPCLVVRLVHAQIANGWVREIDTAPAEAIPGVVAVFTYKDVPEHRFPTPGHPWSVEPAHQDVADRRLLDDRVRIYGDDIAVVVAEDNVVADRGVRAVLAHTTYEELPVMTTVEQALASDAPVLHPEVLGCLRFPRAGYEGFAGTYCKYGKREALEIATMGVSCLVKMDEDCEHIADIRLAFGVAGPYPKRATATEDSLRGLTVDEAVARVGELACAEMNPRTSWRASKEFRLQLIAELSRRLIRETTQKGGAHA